MTTQIIAVSACWILFVSCLGFTSTQTADRIASAREKSEHHSW